MPDYVIDLTCLRCGERFPARIALLADNVEQSCPDCENKQQRRESRKPLHLFWERVKRRWSR